ncbi:MAG: hypothetical protein J6T45_06025 [Fibrobacterales bacterium]|nr:hypothetical protein [Fibrobacterales bacterium]
MATTGNSSPVFSNQSGPHPDLERVVLRHARAEWRKPLARFSEEVWRAVAPLLEGSPRIELDSGCGTGLSTLALARAAAASGRGGTVVGADRSPARLGRGLRSVPGAEPLALDAGFAARATIKGARPAQLVLARAELSDFWRLFLASGFRAEKHWILYPNPWPRGEHLMRRWHGHPVFPLLPRLAPETELRTNWRIYAEEFARAWELLGLPRPEVERFEVDPAAALTPFERKYALSGHELWRVRCAGD